MEVIYQLSGTIMGTLNNRPVGVLIYHSEIIESIMCQEISTDILEWVHWRYNGFWGCTWLGQKITP